jgi:hypothetical protein
MVALGSGNQEQSGYWRGAPGDPIRNLVSQKRLENRFLDKRDIGPIRWTDEQREDPTASRFD